MTMKQARLYNLTNYWLTLYQTTGFVLVTLRDTASQVLRLAVPMLRACFVAVSSLFLGCCLLAGQVSTRTFSYNHDEQLRRYIEEALDRNPAVQAAFAEYHAAIQKIPEAAALPDPVMSVSKFFRNPNQSLMISISQKFPWFGKRETQAQIATREAAELRATYEAKKADVVLQIKLAYYELAYIDAAILITEEDLSLLRHFERVARTRYAHGAGLQQDVVKLQAEITRALNRLSDLGAMRTTLEARLNRLLNRPANSPISKIQLTDPPRVRATQKQLLELALRNRPEVFGSLFRLEREEKRIELARKNYWPDIDLSSSFMTMSSLRSGLPADIHSGNSTMSAFGFMISVNLPIYRRKYDAAVFEATEMRHAASMSYRELVNSIEEEIRTLLFRVQTLQDQIELFQNTLLPQARQALTSAEAAYVTGQRDLLDLLDSERVLLDVRLTLEQLRSEYMQGLARIERAVGCAFPIEEHL